MNYDLRNRPELLFYGRLAEAKGMWLYEIMELPASEINFWREYYSIFPFPQERDDARTALLAQTISNMSSRMLKDTHLTKIDDFMPTYLLNEQEIEERFVQRQIERERKMGQRFLQSKDAQ